MGRLGLRPAPQWPRVPPSMLPNMPRRIEAIGTRLERWYSYHQSERGRGMRTNWQGPPLRRDWLYRVAREFQLLAGRLALGRIDSVGFQQFLDTLPAPQSLIESSVVHAFAEQVEVLTGIQIPASLSGHPTVSPRSWATARRFPHAAEAQLARAVLASRFTEAWTIPRLAREVGCNRTLLERAFEELTGMTIHQFLVQQRIETGKHLIAHTSLKLTTVPSEVGYRSKPPFFRHFRQLTGMTPGEYRRLFRG